MSVRMPFTLRLAKARPSWIFGVLVILLTLAAAGRAHAGSDADTEDRDNAWKEVAASLPAAPTAENLLPFYVSPTASQRFAIDAKSVSVGTDGVVRYTLLATSASGAKSISYEGIRCDGWQTRLYAFGHPDGSWSRARRDEWTPINRNAANRQQAVLAADYFCQGSTVAGKAAEMVERIRWKRSLQQFID